MNLILSLAALALGPLLYGALRKADFMRSSLDGFLFVTIAGIVIVYIVPDVFDVAGFIALVFLALGISFALGVEHHSASRSGGSYAWVVILGSLGLVVHAAMDGIALLPTDHLHIPGTEHLHGHHAHEEGHAHAIEGLVSNHLALGVILHRIPVGMAIWWTLRPQIGSVMAIAALGLIAAATTVAYLFGDAILDVLQTSSVACFQAFVAGSLLHVIVFSTVRHRTQSDSLPQKNNVVGERLGVIAGLFLIYLVPHVH